jgi:hypothetical protein
MRGGLWTAKAVSRVVASTSASTERATLPVSTNKGQ